MSCSHAPCKNCDGDHCRSRIAAAATLTEHRTTSCSLLFLRPDPPTALEKKSKLHCLHSSRDGERAALQSTSTSHSNAPDHMSLRSTAGPATRVSCTGPKHFASPTLSVVWLCGEDVCQTARLQPRSPTWSDCCRREEPAELWRKTTLLILMHGPLRRRCSQADGKLMRLHNLQPLPLQCQKLEPSPCPHNNQCMPSNSIHIFP